MIFRLGTAALALAFAAGCAALDPNGSTPSSTPPASNQPTQVGTSERGVIPVGQELDVRLQNRLSSETAEVEQRFEATTVVDLMQGSTVLVPAGSTVRGVVSDVEAAGRVDRAGKLALTFDRLTIGSRNYQIKAMPVEAFESGGIRDEARTVGAGGAVGAIVGGIIGGLKGALIGAAVGAGGVIAATEGSDVVLPAGTVIRMRMDAPVEIR